MEPNFDVIESFFNRIGERKRQTLAAIHPVKPGLHGSTYEANQRQQMLRYIAQKQREGFGIYYSLNEGIPVFSQRGFNGKLLASEIINVHMFGFDIDWITGSVGERQSFETQALELILKFDSSALPSLVVSTGGGIQVLFVLDTPLPVALSNTKIPTAPQAIADVLAKSYRDDFTRLYADIVIALTELLDPMLKANVCKIDKLSNIDRVFRLPGTVNFPTPVKIEKGATVRLATIIYDKGEYCDFHALRSATLAVAPVIERKERAPYRERENKKWTHYAKAKFLCEYIREKMLIDDNQNYTHALMFPLFGMINRTEITAEQGRELWLLATETGRSTAHGDWTKKWDTRKIANYVGRDLGTIVFFCREHGCLMPWSSKDYEESAAIEARTITAESLRHPVVMDIADQDELTGF
jgi:hypothetical protein